MNISVSTDFTNSAAIQARGGDADTAVPGSNGGDGGVVIYSYGGVKTDTGTVDVSGGSGNTGGSAGVFTP